jgi:hypothetical protein
MLLLPKAEHLILGFWLGAMVTSVTVGLVIVFALHGSSVPKTTRHTVSPAVDLAIAGLLVLAAAALDKGEDVRLRERHAARHPKDAKKTPKWQQKLREGNPWQTFVVGIVLSFPGVSRRSRSTDQAALLSARGDPRRDRLLPRAARLDRGPHARVQGLAKGNPDGHRERQDLGLEARQNVRRVGACDYRRTAGNNRGHRLTVMR